MKLFVGLCSLLAVSSALAGQGVVLTPGQILNFPLPSSVPYSSLSSTRVEMRFHAWTAPANLANVISLPEFEVRLAGSGFSAPLIVTDWVDSFTEGQGNGLYLNINGMTDVVVRVQRDTVAMTLNAQVWSADGNGATISASIPIDSLGVASLPAQGIFGEPAIDCILDYVRWFSQTVPPGNNPVVTSTGNLADFEFEGNLTDASAQHLVMTPTEPPVFVSAPRIRTGFLTGPATRSPRQCSGGAARHGKLRAERIVAAYL